MELCINLGEWDQIGADCGGLEAVWCADFDSAVIRYSAGGRTWSQFGGMGQCYGKTIPTTDTDATASTITTTVVQPSSAGYGGDPSRTPSHYPSASGGGNGAVSVKNTPARTSYPSPWPSPYPHGVGASPLPVGVSPSPARASTPGRFFKRRFAPPSPAKHIKASLAKRFGYTKPKEGPIPEERGAEPEQLLDKSFGYAKNFGAKYELGKEVGRGHFGHTCSAKGKKGELRDQPVAVKIISKSKVLQSTIFKFALSITSISCFLNYRINFEIISSCFYVTVFPFLNWVPSFTLFSLLCWFQMYLWFDTLNTFLSRSLFRFGENCQLKHLRLMIAACSLQKKRWLMIRNLGTREAG